MSDGVSNAFSCRPLGIPHLEKVTLFNVDSNKSIDMTSISGSTVHFHSSFFEDKVRIFYQKYYYIDGIFSENSSFR